MKEKLKRVSAFQQAVHFRLDRLIERLSQNAIAQEERRYELMYGKPLSEKEKMEIKKEIVLKWSLLLAVPVLILILTLMNQGVWL